MSAILNWSTPSPAMQSRLACIVLKAGQAPRNLHGSLASSTGQWSVPSLQSGGIDDEFISSSDRVEYWLERTRFRSTFFSLSECAGLGGAWVPPEGGERLGCTNPSTSTSTLPTLTTVGELLDEDESSFEDAFFKGPAEPLSVVFNGPAEPLAPVLEGTTEPSEAVLEGSAEPLTVSELFAGSHRTRASADVGLDLPEEAWVPADTDPGRPARQRNVLKIELFWAGKKQPRQRRLTLDTFHFFPGGSGSGSGERTYLQRPQSASWPLPTVWLPKRICVSQRGIVESPFPSARPGNL